ncbi:MAG: hypothetical protein AAF267_12185 [Deinococcota bacterium]
MDSSKLVWQLHTAFANAPYPGDTFLQSSSDGHEPQEALASFAGKWDWTELDADFLDRHADALNFMSAGALRFFLPAYLVADVQGTLVTADPTFQLTYGFHTVVLSLPVNGQTFSKHTGGDTLINPQRYGAISAKDYSRYRLAVFCREEAGAIVAYLQYMQTQRTDPAIATALNDFWLDRAENAPTNADLSGHLDREQAFLDAVSTTKQA